MDLVVQVLECLAHTLSYHHTCLTIKTSPKWMFGNIRQHINMTTFVFFKSLVHPKISPCFTHPQGIVGVHNFQTNPIKVYLKKKWSLLFQTLTYNGMGGCFCNSPKSSQIKHIHPY